MLRRLGVALLFMVAVLLLPSAAWAEEVDCTATPDDPACVVEPTPEPTPTPTPEPTPTAEPSPMVETVEPAPGVDTGVYLDPATGSLRVDENTGVALGVACWLGALVCGLSTAWLVLP